MRTAVGKIEALFRYPVKSMRGERLDRADLGWHGLTGDRRLALRRIETSGGFPWLTASRFPQLLLFVPERSVDESLPTQVRTPDGEAMAIFDTNLAREVARRHGSPVEMMHLDRGIFDEASVSLITSATVEEIGRLAAFDLDVRRFRPNILMSSMNAVAFEEEEWVGGVLSFGEGLEGAAISITHRDERCAMVNLDPDSARATPAVLKTIARERDNQAGVYASVLRRGRLEVGMPAFFERAVQQR